MGEEIEDMGCSLGEYKDISLVAEGPADGNSPEDRGESASKKQKISRWTGIAKEVRGLISAVTKVYHLAQWDAVNVDEVLARVAPLIPFVGGERVARGIVLELMRACKRRLHEAGEDCMKRVIEDKGQLAVLVLGLAYGNAVDLSTDKHAVDLARTYTYASQKYSKQGISKKDRRIEISKVMALFAQKAKTDPTTIRLCSSFGAHKSPTTKVKKESKILGEGEVNAFAYEDESSDDEI